MGIFNRKKKVLDLSEHYRKQQEKIDSIRAEQGSFSSQSSSESSSSSEAAPFPFFANDSSTSSSTENSCPALGSSNSYSNDSDEKRRKLLKRLADMTEKIENLSNQIYHLEQRLEVVEKKSNVSPF